jgi:hypothetical protein
MLGRWAEWHRRAHGLWRWSDSRGGSTAPPTERSITAAGSTAAYTDRIVADTTSAAFSLGLPAAASGQLPFVITNIGPNLLTLTGMVSGE